jgi:hypothetical protein
LLPVDNHIFAYYNISNNKNMNQIARYSSDVTTKVLIRHFAKIIFMAERNRSGSKVYSTDIQDSGDNAPSVTGRVLSPAKQVDDLFEDVGLTEVLTMDRPFSPDPHAKDATLPVDQQVDRTFELAGLRRDFEQERPPVPDRTPPRDTDRVTPLVYMEGGGGSHTETISVANRMIADRTAALMGGLVANRNGRRPVRRSQLPRRV